MLCGVCFVDIVLCGEMGVFGVFIVLQWGFYDVFFSQMNKDFVFKFEGDCVFKLQCLYGSYVMENVFFKIFFFVEFYLQIVCEVVVKLYFQVVDCIDEIDKIVLMMYELVICIIFKEGDFVNLVDCDYCLQYMMVVLLFFGDFVVEYYEDDFYVVYLEIDMLCSKMVVEEDECYSCEYYDLVKCFIVNVVQVFFNDGIFIEKIEIEYLIGYCC